MVIINFPRSTMAKSVSLITSMTCSPTCQTTRETVRIVADTSFMWMETRIRTKRPRNRGHSGRTRVTQSDNQSPEIETQHDTGFLQGRRFRCRCERETHECSVHRLSEPVSCRPTWLTGSVVSPRRVHCEAGRHQTFPHLQLREQKREGRFLTDSASLPSQESAGLRTRHFRCLQSRETLECLIPRRAKRCWSQPEQSKRIFPVVRLTNEGHLQLVQYFLGHKVEANEKNKKEKLCCTCHQETFTSWLSSYLLSNTPMSTRRTTSGELLFTCHQETATSLLSSLLSSGGLPCTWHHRRIRETLNRFSSEKGKPGCEEHFLTDSMRLPSRDATRLRARQFLGQFRPEALECHFPRRSNLFWLQLIPEEIELFF